MKKLITLCFFAFAMVLGTQTVAAQSMVEINSIASKKSQELKKNIKFSDKTEHAIYEAYQAYESKMASITKHEAAGDVVSKDDKLSVKKTLDATVEKLLDAEQYQLYLKLSADMK